jgi:dTDP-4-amino-4,6-dideoxygalactose transaminase
MIRMNEFSAEVEALLASQAAAAERVIRSGWYILGSELAHFESSFAAWTGLPYVAGVGNGMDAIEIGLRAAGVGPGDEIITTPMTAYATVLAVYRAGATPVLADLDPGTALLDLSSVERCLSPRTKGVLLVQLYGRVPDMDAWTSFCSSHGIALFEDCAQAHGARWKGRHAGSFGSFGAFSFYPTKNLGALGDAGAVASTSAALDAEARILRNYGQTVRYHHERIGLNSRLDELQAAILSERLKWLDRFIERRRQIAAAFDRGIANPQVRPLDPPAERENHVYHLYVVACSERDRLAAHLKERGIEALIHYPVPVHEQPPTKDIRRDPRGLEAAERHAATCLSLPCHPQMSDEDVAAVIKGVNSFA